MENIVPDDVSSSKTRKNTYMIQSINASSKLSAHLCILLPVSCLFVRFCNEDILTLGVIVVMRLLS